MKVHYKVFISLLILVFASACGGSGEINTQDAWARPAFLGDNSATYLIITNGSELDDSLIGASTDVAGAAEIHLSKMDADGNMTMEPQNLIVFPAGTNVEFSPGGMHIMLVNLTRDLNVGDIFPLTLEFQRAGDITVEIEVRAP
jgi:copper(I)-binding protein